METINIKITIAGKGDIFAELYPQIAPATVQNFLKLIDDGFYNGLIFHRVIAGFMIQGGCPLGKGTGNPGWCIKGEFAINGCPNPLSHTRGVLSMARSNDPNSAGSQFFIMHEDSTFLDGQYAAFGKVTNGIEIVDQIANCQKQLNDRPAQRQTIESIVRV